MGVADPNIPEKIKQFLKWQPRGMTISDLTPKLKMNRNLVAKHLDLLLVSGSIEMRYIGTAKVFSLSNRIPISGLLEFSSDLVIVLDHENTIRRVNEQALMALGLHKGDIVGKKIRQTGNTFLDSLPSIEPHQETSDIKERTCELLCQVNGDTRSFRIKTIATTLEDASHGTTLVIEDITDRQRYQELLEKSAAQYRGIVEDQSDFIVRFLPDGMTVFSNTSYARYLGKTSDGITGRQFLAGICEEDRNTAWESVRAVTLQKPVTILRYRVLHEGMTPRWNQWTVRGLFHESGALREYQAVGQDITEKQAASKKIRAYIGGMEFLSRTAMAFIDMDDDEDIYRFITDQIYGFCPDLIVAANSFDMARGTATLRSISGFSQGSMEKLSEWHVNPIGMTFPLENDMTAEEIVSRKCLTPGPARLYDLFFRMVPENVCTRIEDLITWGGCYAMGVVCRGEIFGSIVLIVQKGKTLENKETIEAFISQAGFALLHRRTLESVSAPIGKSADKM